MTGVKGTVSICLSLLPELFAAIESIAEPVRQRVEAELAELASDLAVRTQPVVRLEAAEERALDDAVRVFADDVPCPFSRATIAAALAYATETVAVELDSGVVVERLRDEAGSRPELVGETLALVVRTAVSAQPGAVFASSRESAARSVLDLGMPLAARDGDAEATEGFDPVESSIAALAAPTIDVLVDRDYLRFLASLDPGAERFPLLRDGLFVELGLRLPAFHFRVDEELRPAAFAFRVNSVRTLPRIGLPAGTIMVNDTAERMSDVHGVAAEPTVNPATDQPCSLASAQHAAALEELGLTTWDPFGYLILSLAAALRRSAHTLMTRDVASAMVGELRYAFPFLADATAEYVRPDVLARALRELLLERVSIRNLRRILELLIRHETEQRDDGAGSVAFVRAGLAEQVAHAVARGTATVVAYLLDEPFESAFLEQADAATSTGPDSLAEQLRSAVRIELRELPATAAVPALLTADAVRRPIADVLRHEFPQLRVLGYRDLPFDRNVQPIARILAPT
ncbi:MAG: FHIPEP family type III secretion protein [Gaiellaceae bacterium]